jgi:outer membrane protein TolC
MVAISVGVLFVCCNCVSSQEAEKINPNIKNLQEKRLEVLGLVCDVARKLYQNARIEYTDVLSADRELFAARLEYATTPEERIRACDAAIDNARQSQAIAKAHQDGARGTPVAVLRAQAFELEAQIAREKAEVGK